MSIASSIILKKFKYILTSTTLISLLKSTVILNHVLPYILEDNLNEISPINWLQQ